jgi:hypothetical protein
MSVDLSPTSSDGKTSLSYKFQRLRERLRAAVASGELHGKLPGERALAKRFNVNAKTLSKALTDLAAEGLLDRSIGRGTYVKGSAPAATASAGRWLIFATPEQAKGSLVRRLTAAAPDVCLYTDRKWNLRPSFLQPVTAVVSLDPTVPESLLRDLVVRNLNVVTVDYQPKVFSMHAVIDDTFTSAAHLARTLLMDGHRAFITVESTGAEHVNKALRDTAQRVAPDATVDRVAAADVASVTSAYGTAIICETIALADEVRAHVADRPDLTVWAIGCVDGEPRTPGCYTDEQHKVAAIVAAVTEPPARPMAVWLAGQFKGPGATTGGATVVLPSGRANVAMAS